MWTVLLREKSEAFEKFKIFKNLVEQETRTLVKTLRTDRGGEFMSHEFKLFCDKNRISRHLTAPYLPQQNGVVERRNRTLLEMTRSILKHLSVPNLMWGESVRHSTYLINRIATRSLEEKTPYEVLRSRKPNISHIRVFGCVCYARTEAAGRKKLDDRLGTLVHLGTEPAFKAYRLIDPISMKIVVSRDIIFDEEKEWNWNLTGKEEDNSGGSFVFDPRGVENHSEAQAIGNNEENGNNDTNDEGDTYEITDDEEGDDEAEPQHRRSSHVSTKPSYLDDYMLLAEIECERLLMAINNEP